MEYVNYDNTKSDIELIDIDLDRIKGVATESFWNKIKSAIQVAVANAFDNKQFVTTEGLNGRTVVVPFYNAHIVTQAINGSYGNAYPSIMVLDNDGISVASHIQYTPTQVEIILSDGVDRTGKIIFKY